MLENQLGTEKQPITFPFGYNSIACVRIYLQDRIYLKRKQKKTLLKNIIDQLGLGGQVRSWRKVKFSVF